MSDDLAVLLDGHFFVANYILIVIYKLKILFVY